MAALTAATTERPHVGDIKWQLFKFAAVADGDTFTVPGVTRVLGAFSISVGTNATVNWLNSAFGAALTAKVSAGNPAVTLLVAVA